MQGRAAKPSPTPCRRVRAEKHWDDPTSNYLVMLWELWDHTGFHPVAPKLWVPSCSQWAAKILPYWGKKHGLDKKRCLSWLPACGEVPGAARAGVSSAHGSAEQLVLVRCTPWGHLSRPSARRHRLIKPVTNGQKVYCPCTAAYDPINHGG